MEKSQAQPRKTFGLRHVDVGLSLAGNGQEECDMAAAYYDQALT